MASPRETIHVLASKNRIYGMKFKEHEVNHLLQNLVPRYHLGATPGRLYEAFESYIHGEPCLEPWTPSEGMVNKENWKDFLGQSKYLADYTEFFDMELLERGINATIQVYFPILAEGLSGELFHPLIHLGLGVSINSGQVIAEGLAYMAYSFRSLGKIPQIADVPLSKTKFAKILQIVKNSVTYDKLWTNQDPFERRMQILAQDKSEELVKAAKQWDMQDDEVHEASKIISHALTFLYNLVGVRDQALMHLVLSLNSLKFVLSTLRPKEAVLGLRYFFLAAIAVYVAKDRPNLSKEPTYLSSEFANWKDLIDFGINQDIDEHISMFIWAARVNEKEWGESDPIFCSTAALVSKRITSTSSYKK